jgi:outer membrane protein OmpA-like peptidoglycan-associated protein
MTFHPDLLRSALARSFRAVALLLIAGGSAAAQEATDPVPADARRKVVNLVYRVEQLQQRTQTLQMNETATELRVELSADVLFDFDKAAILPKAEESLRQVAAVISEKGSGEVRIEGHTDAKGSAAYNQRLSERRAEAVSAWLSANGGVSRGSVTTVGFGATRPVAPNAKPDGSDDPDGRQRNRRVEIVVKKRK